MLRAFVKWATVLAKRPQCLLFSTVKGGMNILCSYLNCSTIVNWKTRKRTNTLKVSQRMGGGWIFLKTFRASLFMKTYRMGLISAKSISLDSTFNAGPERNAVLYIFEIWNLFQLFTILREKKLCELILMKFKNHLCPHLVKLATYFSTPHSYGRIRIYMCAVPVSVPIGSEQKIFGILNNVSHSRKNLVSRVSMKKRALSKLS